MAPTKTLDERLVIRELKRPRSLLGRMFSGTPKQYYSTSSIEAMLNHFKEHEKEYPFYCILGNIADISFETEDVPVGPTARQKTRCKIILKEGDKTLEICAVDNYFIGAAGFGLAIIISTLSSYPNDSWPTIQQSQVRDKVLVYGQMYYADNQKQIPAMWAYSVRNPDLENRLNHR